VSTDGWNATELLVVSASRLMEDATTAFIGTGIPMLAAALAQKTHAPSLVPVFEFGGTGARLSTLPRAVGESRTFHRAVAAAGICEVMEAAQRGFIDYGFVGGAQIDAFGNLNTTVIGPDHDRPKVRLPGSGGANDLASSCWKIIAVMRHDAKRFVERLDFLTTPGWLDGPGAREEAGLAPGTGPWRVVTDLAILGYHPVTKRMMPLARQPGVTMERILAATSFAMPAEDVPEADPPGAEELRILREAVDPERLYI
jgi:glutaconate CoA-transferase subunit B